MTDVLEKIAAYKREEVAAAKRETSLAALETEIEAQEQVRGFARQLHQFADQNGMALIAEIKKASPSKGLIRADFDPAALAGAYHAGGAACLSVLTDQPSFQGHPRNLALARAAVPLPLLRKDFLLDTYQVFEARAWGADAILIIMAMVDDALAEDLYGAAKSLDLDALVEVHNEAELERALALGASLIGVNNRNLRDFSTDLTTTERLAAKIPSGHFLVTESGIFTHAEVKKLQGFGARAVLVGEALMRQEDVRAATRSLLESEVT